MGNSAGVSNNAGVALTSGKPPGVRLVSKGVPGGLPIGVETEVTDGTVATSAVGMTSTTVPSGAWTTVWPCRL